VRLLWYAGCLLTCLSVLACQPDRLDKALRGKLPPVESNEVITEYCQSCHIHRAFNPVPHIARVHSLYDRAPYTTEAECRLCHLVKEDTWGTKLRKTLWPAQVARGKKFRH
jgi:hypothetical protein